MHRFHTALVRVLAAALLGTTIVTPAQAAPAGFDATVESTGPLAYFTLDALSGTSTVSSVTWRSTGGVTVAAAGPPISVPGRHSLALNGKDGEISTSLAGGVGAAGSIMAWVELAETPAKTGRIVYLAGISEAGNDFDLQFEPDNSLKLYTASGSSLSYAVPAAGLAGTWHLIVASFGTGPQSRAIYWDGKLVAHDAGGPNSANKMKRFTIGASDVFTGRWLHGRLADVAVWNAVLAPAQVAAIWQSRTVPPGAQ
jgi:hypothetical protein